LSLLIMRYSSITAKMQIFKEKCKPFTKKLAFNLKKVIDK